MSGPRGGNSEAALARYRAELVRWAARMNLVGSTDETSLDRHFSDSLHAVGQIPEGIRVVDLGSGAGFPGLPIAIVRPDLRMTLVEIREKRVAFLRHVVRSLEIEVDVQQVSLESPPEVGFDLALIRAVAPPPQSAEIAERWVRPGAEIWIWAGPEGAVPGATPLPLPSGGAILRVPAAALSRGTP